jgi:magnesium transporter
MLRFIKRSKKPAGASPGSLVFVGDQKVKKVRITVMDYDADQLIEDELDSVESTFKFKKNATTSWINVDGLHDIEMLGRIGEYFGIHPLSLEDILNTGQRPKSEDFDEYMHITFKMLIFDSENMCIRSEQISLIVGENYLISFQEAEGDVFHSVRERIRKGKARIRTGGSGYLAYALVDAVVDHYFTVLEAVGGEIESLEGKLIDDPDTSALETIHNLKREMIFFRKQAWPMREMINNLEKSESNVFKDASGIFLADVYDHTIQVIDTIESFRDLLSSMQDLYLSTVSNRMNEVMKLLTIIATIFIPITFLAGIYGMNFDFMPELHWKGAYFILLGVMALIGIGMVIFFRRKNWL